MRRLAWAGGLFLGLWLLAVPSASAVITALTPLSAQLKESTFIVVAKVDTLDLAKRTMIVMVEEQLKDKLPFARLPVNPSAPAPDGLVPTSRTHRSCRTSRSDRAGPCPPLADMS